MRANILAAFLSAGLAASCAHPSKVEFGNSVFTPSLLNSDPNRYHNKWIIVRGALYYRPHTHVLYESKELNDERRRRAISGDKSLDIHSYDKYCLTIANPHRLGRIGEIKPGATVTLTGRFIANHLDDQSIDLGGCNLPTAILVSKVDC